MDTTHTFSANHVETRWAIARRIRARYTVDVLFPSWGKSARVEAVLRGGRRVTLAQLKAKRRDVSLRDVVYFYLAGEETGYVVVPIGQRPRATAHILKPRAQSSAPRPGPTLAVQLAHGRQFRRLGLRGADRPGRQPPGGRDGRAAAAAPRAGAGGPAGAGGVRRRAAEQRALPAGRGAWILARSSRRALTSTSTTSGSNWPPAPSRSSLTANHGRIASR